MHKHSCSFCQTFTVRCHPTDSSFYTHGDGGFYFTFSRVPLRRHPWRVSKKFLRMPQQTSPHFSDAQFGFICPFMNQSLTRGDELSKADQAYSWTTKKAALLMRKTESMWDRQSSIPTTVVQLEHEAGLAHANAQAFSCLPHYSYLKKLQNLQAK